MWLRGRGALNLSAYYQNRDGKNWRRERSHDSDTKFAVSSTNAKPIPINTTLIFLAFIL